MDLRESMRDLAKVFFTKVCMYNLPQNFSALNFHGIWQFLAELIEIGQAFSKSRNTFTDYHWLLIENV